MLATQTALSKKGSMNIFKNCQHFSAKVHTTHNPIKPLQRILHPLLSCIILLKQSPYTSCQAMTSYRKVTYKYGRTNGKQESEIFSRNPPMFNNVFLKKKSCAGDQQLLHNFIMISTEARPFSTISGQNYCTTCRQVNT